MNRLKYLLLALPLLLGTTIPDNTLTIPSINGKARIEVGNHGAYIEHVTIGANQDQWRFSSSREGEAESFFTISRDCTGDNCNTAQGSTNLSFNTGMGEGLETFLGINSSTQTTPVPGQFVRFPVATSSTWGVVSPAIYNKVYEQLGLSLTGQNLQLTTNGAPLGDFIPIPLATTTMPGWMSHSDKDKLDRLSDSLGTWSATRARSEITLSSSLMSGGLVLPEASDSLAGLLSAENFAAFELAASGTWNAEESSGQVTLVSPNMQRVSFAVGSGGGTGLDLDTLEDENSFPADAKILASIPGMQNRPTLSNRRVFSSVSSGALVLSRTLAGAFHENHIRKIRGRRVH